MWLRYRNTMSVKRTAKILVLGTLDHHNINSCIDQRIGIRVNSLPHCLNSFFIQMGNDVRYCGGMVFISPLIEKLEQFQ